METNGKLEHTYTSTLENKKDRKMKNIQFIYSKITLFLGLVFITVASCERPISDEVEFASYATTGEIFTDGFQGGLDYFPFGGSFAEAFSVETDVTYRGEASMRFDIPSFGVGYGGATFPSTAPRDLSNYDALTFWAKATQGADINEIGFGIDGDISKFRVDIANLAISTKWTKYIIPIPDPSKLIEQTGMFWYAEGAESADDDGGYTFWIDDLQFEKLGTIAQPQPAIFNGSDLNQRASVNTTVPITGLTQTFNLASGINQTVNAAPHYFEFKSTDVDVARVNESGEIFIVGEGTAMITASIAGVKAEGSLTIETLVEGSIISIFNDLFADVAVDNYNGFYQDFQTTLGGAVVEDGNNVITYTSLNFVAIEFYGRDGSSVQPVDASDMTHIHIDIRANEVIESSDFIKIELFNNFTLGSESSGSFQINGNDLTSNEWVQFDIPLSSFTGLNGTNALGALFTVSDNTISNASLDNIFFYKE